MPATCFDALDRHIVAGAAERTALVAGDTSWTYARLLEEVAAFGGVLRHCGVRRADQVDVTLPESPEAVVAVLACARIGAEPIFVPVSEGTARWSWSPTARRPTPSRALTPRWCW